MSFKPNDRVLLRVPSDQHTHKLSNQWEGPYRIASPTESYPTATIASLTSRTEDAARKRPATDCASI